MHTHKTRNTQYTHTNKHTHMYKQNELNTHTQAHTSTTLHTCTHTFLHMQAHAHIHKYNSLHIPIYVAISIMHADMSVLNQSCECYDRYPIPNTSSSSVIVMVIGWALFTITLIACGIITTILVCIVMRQHSNNMSK